MKKTKHRGSARGRRLQRKIKTWRNWIKESHRYQPPSRELVADVSIGRAVVVHRRYVSEKSRRQVEHYKARAAHLLLWFAAFSAIMYFVGLSALGTLPIIGCAICLFPSLFMAIKLKNNLTTEETNCGGGCSD